MPQTYPSATSSSALPSARSNFPRPLVMRLGRKRPAAAASLRIDFDDRSSAADADSLPQESVASPLHLHPNIDVPYSSSSSAESSPLVATAAAFSNEDTPDVKRAREDPSLAPTLNDVPSRGFLTPIASPKVETPFLSQSAPGAVRRLGPYELVGAVGGTLCHAVDVRNKSIKVCQALPQAQFDHLLRVTARLNAAESLWKYGDAQELREAVLPRAVDVATDKEGRRYLFTPATYGSLHGFVQGRKQRLTENDTRDLYRQIVRLIAFCHRLGIVVRDLKLRKFVFADRAQTKLRLNGVFDLVVCPDVHDDRMKDRHGCPAYVSPEILDMAGPSYSGKAADIWSLGVLLFVLLIGRYPFYDSTPQGLFGRIRAGHFAIPADAAVSYPARALIHGLLRRDPLE
uniref:Protein kinase domain-containing protein n=1 Tax=Plectus sambesii TaxID=2011161 RepID=A0A914WGE2_9BILA